MVGTRSRGDSRRWVLLPTPPHRTERPDVSGYAYCGIPDGTTAVGPAPVAPSMTEAPPN